MHPSPSPSGVPFCVGAAFGRPLRAVFLFGVGADSIAFCFRRGGYHPPVLSGEKWVRGDFACGRVPFAAVQKEPKDRRGRLTGIYNALSRLPRTPCFFYGRATKGRGCIHPARAKDRIPLLAPPAAAPCCLNRLISYKSHRAWLSTIAGRFGGGSASAAGARYARLS